MREIQDRGRPAGGGRDFTDIIWQIGERRCCDEVLIHYDCGHCMRADVWVPALPKTHEYTNHELERKRYMQHSFFVLTKDPQAPKVQITVPEGRCRHCGRGNRLALLCGHVQMDIAEEQEKDGNRARAAVLQQMRQMTGAARRLELVLSSHVFLAAMGQVCRLPDDVSAPPLWQGSNTGSIMKPVEGPLPGQEASTVCTRKDIEDQLRAKVVKYIGGATCLLLLLANQCLYLLIRWTGGGGGETQSFSRSIIAELANMTSAVAVGVNVSNSSWPISMLANAFNTVVSTVDALKTSGFTGSNWLSWILQPLGFVVSWMMMPLAWMLDALFAAPRFLLNALYILAYGLVWRPCCWYCCLITDFVKNPMIIFQRWSLLAILDQVSLIAVTNAMLGGTFLSVLVAVLSAPQALSLSLQSVWGELPSLGLAKMGDKKQTGLSRLLPHNRKENGGAKKGSKDKEKTPHNGGNRGDRGERERVEANGGRADKDGRGHPGSSSQFMCFVCLERPSHYILEPCGHHVVCGECAAQLVEVASRGRPMSEAAGGHRPSEKSGGTCPSCGSGVKQAMRVFN